VTGRCHIVAALVKARALFALTREDQPALSHAWLRVSVRFRDGISATGRGRLRGVALPIGRSPFPQSNRTNTMKRILILLAVVLSIASAHAAEPLRVFIRGGKKSYGPQAHEHARFLEKWQPLLTERGMKVDGALEFPTEAQLEQTDVLVMYAQDGSEGTHRRPHARPRCTGARSPRIPDVAEERRPVDCGKVAAPSGARPRGNRTQENPLSPAFRVHIFAPAPGEQQRRPENADESKIRTGIKTPPLANSSQHPQRARPTG